mmetsp:Transcript_46141/g.59276  ORF Transcript_46141/g.59276 Transcript_46141/m.59276 type:complete len:239 (-) Transcript_46141:304-1020(-)
MASGLSADHITPHPTLLQLKARSLRNACTPMKGKPPPSGDLDPSPLVDLYNEHLGDLDKIFDDLGEDPNKAKKYPPNDALDFASKYIVGKYTYVSNLLEIRGRAIVRAGGEENIETILEDNPPEIMVPEEMLDDEDGYHPIDILKIMFPHIEEEMILHVFEVADGSLEDAAAALWFMKIVHTYNDHTDTIKLDSTNVSVDNMTVAQLMQEIAKEELDASMCVGKTELIALLKAHRNEI